MLESIWGKMCIDTLLKLTYVKSKHAWKKFAAQACMNIRRQTNSIRHTAYVLWNFYIIAHVWTHYSDLTLTTPNNILRVMRVRITTKWVKHANMKYLYLNLYVNLNKWSPIISLILIIMLNYISLINKIYFMRKPQQQISSFYVDANYPLFCVKIFK